MRLLIIADGRNQNTRGWLKAISQIPNISIHLISSYPATKIEGLASQHTVPVAFGAYGGLSRKVGGSSKANGKEKLSIKKKIIKGITLFRGPLLKIRYYLGPLTLSKQARLVDKIIEEIKPDIVHSLRIPFEGMLASASSNAIPNIVSIWGNDLTLHANGSFLMRKWTQKAIEHCDGLIADADRDIRLAKDWGLSNEKSTLVVPGGGGIPVEELLDEVIDLSELLGEEIDPERQVIVNPRGVRGYVRNDTFFKAIPEVVSQFPDILFVCPSMVGEPIAEHWINELGIQDNVRLLPLLPHKEIWGLFRRAKISVSISEHDGTPNSLLEAMACGSYPIVGNIESLREWIVDRENGRLVDPGNPEAVAQAIIDVLKDGENRQKVVKENVGIINKRASMTAVTEAMEAFYKNMLK